MLTFRKTLAAAALGLAVASAATPALAMRHQSGMVYNEGFPISCLAAATAVRVLADCAQRSWRPVGAAQGPFTAGVTRRRALLACAGSANQQAWPFDLPITEAN
jgi:hypothetical protein